MVGYLELAYDSLALVAAPDLVLTAYTAEPATTSADLTLLASWAATETTTEAVGPDVSDRAATQSRPADTTDSD